MPVERHRPTEHVLRQDAVEAVARIGRDLQELAVAGRLEDAQMGACRPEGSGSDVLDGPLRAGHGREMPGGAPHVAEPPGGEAGSPVDSRLGMPRTHRGRTGELHRLPVETMDEIATRDEPAGQILLHRIGETDMVVAQQPLRLGRLTLTDQPADGGEPVGDRPALCFRPAGRAVVADRRLLEEFLSGATEIAGDGRWRRWCPIGPPSLGQTVDGRRLRMIGIVLEPGPQLRIARPIGRRMKKALRQHVAHEQAILQPPDQAVGVAPAAFFLQLEDQPVECRIVARERPRHAVENGRDRGGRVDLGVLPRAIATAGRLRQGRRARQQG